MFFFQVLAAIGVFFLGCAGVAYFWTAILPTPGQDDHDPGSKSWRETREGAPNFLILGIPFLAIGLIGMLINKLL
jgi:hypothetical protein